MSRLADVVDTSAYEFLSEGIVIYSAGEKAYPIYANQSLLQLLGCKSIEELREFCHGNCLNLFHPDDLKDHINTIRLAWGNGASFEHHIQYRIISKNGSTHIVNDAGRVIEIPGYDSCRICVITEADSESRMHTGAADSLTGLLGLGQFIRYCANFLNAKDRREEANQYHIAYFNIRRFKEYNMEYGAQKGDLVIKALGRIITRWSTSKVVARIGADQFVAISGSEEMYDRILNIIEEFEFQYGKDGMKLKTGIYSIKEYSEDIHAACDKAKLACDSIKNSADSVCIYSEELSNKMRVNSYIIQHFDEAIAHEHIKVFYQPIIRTLTGKISGVEALARWQDPELGTLSPIDFIPVLEDNFLITKLDLYMLEKICQDMKMMESLGKPLLPTSLNLSRIDFVKADIFVEIEKIVRRYDVPRDLINIEITESMVMGEAEIFTNAIQRFRSVGYQVMMDDFGSGYSSLNILQEFHFDTIKLDMRFLANLNEEGKTIIKSIISMAKKLGVQTLAEGVETEEQHEFLRNIGCEKGQGYLYGRPTPMNIVLEKSLFNHENAEPRKWKQYYNAIGKSDFLTDRSRAIIEYDEQNVSFFYINDVFKKVLHDVGVTDMEMVYHNVNSPESPIYSQLRDLRAVCRVGNGVQEIVYSIRDRYIRLRARCVAELENMSAFEIEISNLLEATRPLDTSRLLNQEIRAALGEKEEVAFIPLIQKGIKESRNINIFWKDAERKFVGANDNFLRTYGFNDISAIIGKTDEDMLWHVDDEPFADDEWAVIKKGEVIRNHMGSCIIQGVAHNIIASKEPIYKDGKIVGLLGTFIVVDDIDVSSAILQNSQEKDDFTGLMPASALTDLIVQYVESYRLHHENFAVLRVSVEEYFRVVRDYGEKISAELLRQLGEIIVEIIGVRGSVARLYGGNFVILAKVRDKDLLKQISEEIVDKLDNNYEILGCPVTVHPVMKLRVADEEENIRDIMGFASGGTMVDSEERRRMEEQLNNYNLRMNTVVDAIPGGIAIQEILTDGSFNTLYASAGVARLTGRTDEEYVGTVTQNRHEGMVESDITYVGKAVYDAIHHNKPIDVSYRLKHVDGHYLWVNMKGRIIGEQNGHPLLLAVFQSNSDLNQSYLAAIDEAVVGVLVNMIETNEIIYENAAIRKLAGTYFQGDSYLLRNEINPDWEKDSLNYEENKEKRYNIVSRGRHLRVHIVDRTWNGRKSNIIYIVDDTDSFKAYDKLKNQSDQLREIVDSLPGIVVVFKKNKKGIISREYVSNLAKKFVAKKSESQDEIMNYIHPNDREWVEKQILERSTEDKNMDITYRMIDTNGDFHWMRHMSNAIPQSDGTCLFYDIYTDVTKEKQVEMQREASVSEKYGEYFKEFNSSDITQLLMLNEFQESMLSSISNIYNSVHVINLTDYTFLKVWCIEAVDKRIGDLKDARETLALLENVFVDPRYREEAKAFLDLNTIQDRIKGQNMICMDFLDKLSGWTRAYFIPVSFNEDQTIREVFFISQPIQTEKMREESLRIASEVDGITQIYNHAAGKNYVNGHIDSGRLGTFYLLDVDNFKAINDNYGHTVGDQVLIGISKCLKQVFTKDDILIRIGGDEFGVFALDIVNPKESEARLAELNKAIANIRINGNDLTVTVSAGFIIADKTGTYSRFDDMYLAADVNMYSHKKKLHRELESGLHTELSDEMPGAILIYQADEDEKILFASKGLVELFDCEDTGELVEYLGGSFKNVVHPDDRERVYQEIDEQIKESGDKSIDHVFYRIISAKGVIKNVEDYGHLAETKHYGKSYFVIITEV